MGGLFHFTPSFRATSFPVPKKSFLVPFLQTESPGTEKEKAKTGREKSVSREQTKVIPGLYLTTETDVKNKDNLRHKNRSSFCTFLPPRSLHFYIFHTAKSPLFSVSLF
ncbi:hypothetical protein HQ39_04260 [Porphyromonas sp. COT-108 OH2963]|nr:hypothetical protein HQ39_04260 [Porphyromonas sp. COT-108 OH2963]